MMWNPKQQKAYWLERLIPLTAEGDYTYADGYVEFGFLSLVDKKKHTEIDGVETDTFEKILETRANLPFKKHDKIRIGGHLQDGVRDNVFRVDSVDEILPKEYEMAVVMFPTKRQQYTIKKLVLK